MSQTQPSSLPYWRTRAVEIGNERALKEAALYIDSLNEAMGRKLDRSTAERFGYLIGGFLAGIVVCAFKGCTTIDAHAKVEGWPELRVIEHHVPHHVMRDRCAKYVAFGAYPEACAEWNLIERTCNIWFSADFPPSKSVIEHERLHCAGYDHIGSTYMRDFLARFKGVAQ